ncbi:MAG: hypothetical protein VKK32_06695 [Candidatus Melainabacteria bacterium]|nr:hypothetical protein [Candidatus Melainabacteria bacterium]
MSLFILYLSLSLVAMILSLFSLKILLTAESDRKSQKYSRLIYSQDHREKNLFINNLKVPCIHLGSFIKKTLKLNSLDKLFTSAVQLGIKEEVFKIWLAKIFIFIFLLEISYLFTEPFSRIILLALLMHSVIEIPLKIHLRKKSIRRSFPHLLSCIKILCIKNNQPLKTALRSIAQGLPQDFSASKNLLIKFIEEFEEFGMQKAIESFTWENDFSEDFKNILIGINLSSSKNELLKFAEKIEKKYHSADETKRNNLIENIQLYLLAPVMLMLLISSYPLFLAIKFSLQGAFL